MQVTEGCAGLAGAEPHAWEPGRGGWYHVCRIDVHKKGIVVAVAEGVLRAESRECGRIANTSAVLDRLAANLAIEEFGFASATKPDRAAIAFNAPCYSRPFSTRTTVLGHQ